MPLTSFFLDKFVAPHFSEFTAVEAPDMSGYDSQQTFWVANYILNSGFSAAFADGQRQLAMGFLRRAESAFVEYEKGRVAALEFVSGSRPRVATYFTALHHFEVFVSVAYQAAMLVRQFARMERIFEAGDGSAMDRLGVLYNFIKHSDDKIVAGQFPAGGMIPVWMFNSGLTCVKTQVTFAEMAELLREMAHAATTISNPEGMRTASGHPAA